jgi:hypothetical protein
MSEQRRQILEMLAEGKITADEAERLIDAVERERTEWAPQAATGSKPKPRYIRVVINSEETGGDGPSRINVRVPLQLLRAGVRLTSLIPPQAVAKVNAQLERNGVPIDLAQLKPQQLEELIDHLDEVTVDVDDPSAKVQVFCE